MLPNSPILYYYINVYSVGVQRSLVKQIQCCSTPVHIELLGEQLYTIEMYAVNEYGESRKTPLSKHVQLQGNNVHKLRNFQANVTFDLLNEN
jgi:hypothetical protein